MAGKPLNKTNLMALGAEVLADLLLETVKGDAARQRRVRMALAADDGPEAVAADIRKRFAAIRRAQSFLNRPAQKKLAQELTGVIELITTRIAPTAPSLAFDLLWAQLHLAEGIHERTDDSWGSIGDTMRAAMEAIGEIAPHLTLSAETLAEQILEATVADGYGAFDHAIDVLAPALGPDGLAALKEKATATFDTPISAADLAQHDYVRHSERESRARAHRNNTLERILQDVADQQGDVDGWMAKYTPEQLTYHTIAPDAASRLLDAGRPEEALALVRTAIAAQRSDWHDPRELDDAHFACLAALGRKEELRDALWARFEKRLCPDALRHHLKMLPDFEDIDAADADLDLWAYANDVTLDFSRPGKPTDNGFIEAFNSKLRSECLNAHWFMSLADAREKLEGWRRHYNEDRPHSAIGYNVPIAMHYPDGVTSPSS